MTEKEAGHPFEVEMVEIDVLFVEVVDHTVVDSFDDLVQFGEGFLDARPRGGVVVEDAVEHFAQAPVGIGLDGFEQGFVDFVNVFDVFKGVLVDLDKVTEIDDDERSYNIIDALDVPAGRMPHVPHIQQPSHHQLDLFVAKQRRIRKCSNHIIIDKLKYFRFTSITLQRWFLNIRLHHLEVIVTFAFQCRFLGLSIGRHVFQ